MPIRILDPAPFTADSDYESDGDNDIDMEDGGVSLAPPKAKMDLGAQGIIVTPGEVVTEDAQWMRYIIPLLLLIHHIPS